MADPEPFQVLDALDKSIRKIWSMWDDSRGNIEKDKEIQKEKAMIERLLLKLDYDFIDKLRDDASIHSQSAEKLKSIEKVLDEIEEEKHKAVHEEHEVFHVVKKVGDNIGKRAKVVEKETKKKIRKLDDEKKDLDKKKKQIVKKQKKVETQKEDLKEAA